MLMTNTAVNWHYVTHSVTGWGRWPGRQQKKRNITAKIFPTSSGNKGFEKQVGRFAATKVKEGKTKDAT